MPRLLETVVARGEDGPLASPVPGPSDRWLNGRPIARNTPGHWSLATGCRRNRPYRRYSAKELGVLRGSVQVCTRRSTMHTVNEDRAIVGSDVLSSTEDVRRMSLVGPALVGVFDGVGGAPAADLASELAARAIFEAGPPRDEQAATELLVRADRVLLDAGASDSSRTGMATTASLISLPENGGKAVVVNVGDSLVALLGADGLHEVSVSDRLGRSRIVQSLGGPAGAEMAPHVASLDLVDGDLLLLATDGLTDVVDGGTLEEVLRDHRDDAVERLLEMVERAGTPDDVTIVTVDIELDGAGSGSTPR